MMATKEYHVKVPKIYDIGTAIRIYYETMHLDTKEIQLLFSIGHCTAIKLKRMAIDLMNERGEMQWDAQSVKTDTAYEAWGLDIGDLEKRYAKLQKYGLRKEGAVQ